MATYRNLMITVDDVRTLMGLNISEPTEVENSEQIIQQLLDKLQVRYIEDLFTQTEIERMSANHIERAKIGLATIFAGKSLEALAFNTTLRSGSYAGQGGSSSLGIGPIHISEGSHGWAVGNQLTALSKQADKKIKEGEEILQSLKFLLRPVWEWQAI